MIPSLHRPRPVRILSPLALACLLLGGGCKDGGKAGAEPDSAGAAAPQPASAEPTDALPKAEAILAKAVEAVGGKEKLDGVESFHYVGDVTIVGQGISGEVELWWKSGDFYTTQEIPGIGLIEEGKLGEEIWSRDPITGLRKLEGDEAEQHRWASSLMLAADWQRYFEKAETIGERTIDGKKAYDVRLSADSGAEVVLTFDAESGLQLEQKFEQVTPLGKAPITAKMEDYRDVDGIKIAFKQVTDTSLAKAEQTIRELDLGAEVDTSKFGMPGHGEEVVKGSDVKPEEKRPTMMPFDEDGKPGRPVPPKP